MDATQPPPIALAHVGDSVVYLEQTDASTAFERPTGEMVVVTSRHDAVIHVIRTAPDTLEAFYEHLRLRVTMAGQERSPETGSLRWQRFVLHDDDGRIETVVTPPQPDEIRQMTDLTRQFDDFFFRIPALPLDVGAEWVDTTEFTGGGQGTAARLTVTRFRVRGDTTMHGVTARVIDYESAIESSMTTPPTTQGTTTSSLVGVEEGVIVFAPDRDVMLSRHRSGEHEGEIVVEGNLETQRLPQTYSYESRIELLPPVVPDAQPAAAPTDDTPPRS
jgi:hypothetical protein